MLKGLLRKKTKNTNSKNNKTIVSKIKRLTQEGRKRREKPSPKNKN